MRSIIFSVLLALISTFAVGQNSERDLISSTNTPEESIMETGVPDKPTITYNLESRENKSYSFRAYSSGATEYEWHVQPTSNISNSFYRGSSEYVVQFYNSMASTQVVCRAKNSAGWSDYTVISVNISF